MPAPSRRFGELLTEGIASVAYRRRKTKLSVEEEIGTLRNVSHHTVRRWEAGYPPRDASLIEALVRFCVLQGRINHRWAADILAQVNYGAGKTNLLAELFPVGPSEPTGVPAEPTRIAYWLGRPPSLGSKMFDRGIEVDTLARAVNVGKTTIIAGGPGTGKTRLAAELTHRVGNTGFWTAAAESVDATLATLAPALGIATSGRTEQEVAGQVRREVALLPAGVLWVVDNLPDIAVLLVELQIAAGSLALVVTTRDSRQYLAPPGVNWVARLPLDTVSAVALLGSRTERAHDPSILGLLAEEVGYLPLALEMLAVRLGESLQPADHLLGEIRNASRPLQLRAFQQVAGTTVPRTQGVFASIVGALDRLGSVLRHQIAPLGYLADAPIPVVLVAALTELDVDGLDLLVATGQRESVITVAGDSIILHALTMAALEATNGPGDAERALTLAGQRLADVVWTDHRSLRTKFPHYLRIQRYSQRSLGPSHSTVLAFATQMGMANRSLGRYVEAIRLDEETLRTHERVSGPEHPETLSSRDHLAADYRDMGRYKEALHLDEKTLAIRKQVLGAEHPDTLTSRHSVGCDHGYLGDFRKAAASHLETFRIMERVLGAEHPDTLRSRHEVADNYRKNSRNEEALGLDLETFSVRQRACWDPNTLTPFTAAIAWP